MSLAQQLLNPLFAGGPYTTYQRKVLTYSPIAYWPLDDTSGAVARCLVNPNQNGAYTGVTLANATGPDGVSWVPLFDGANDYVNILTATLQGALDLDEGSISLWAKVFNVGVWTDATFRRLLYLKDTAPVNSIDLMRYNSDNRVYLERRDDTSGKGKLYITSAPTAWVHLGLTWSVLANETRYYWTGSLLPGVDAADTATGTVVLAFIGSASTVPANPWYGWISDVAIFDTVLSGANIAALASA